MPTLREVKIMLDYRLEISRLSLETDLISNDKTRAERDGKRLSSLFLLFGSVISSDDSSQ